MKQGQETNQIWTQEAGTDDTHNRTLTVIDLQCNNELKTKFSEAQGNADKTAQFLRELPPCFPELSKVFSRLMCLFGSTYLCEKLFSTMNFNKCKFRSRLSDAHLEAVLRVSTVNSIRANVLSCVSRSAVKCLARNRIVCKCIQRSQLFSVRFSTVLISYIS